MSVARHNPQDAQGDAKALTWDERMAQHEAFSVENQIKRFLEYRQRFVAQHRLVQGLQMNEAHLQEKRLIRQDLLDSGRLAGPNNSPWGLFGKIRKEVETRYDHLGKAKPGPKKHFDHTDNVLEMHKIENFLSASLPESIRRYEIPSEPIVERNAHLKGQYIEAHMLYVNMLEAARGIKISPEHRNDIYTAFGEEYDYLQHNPGAPPKDMKNILDTYHLLGKPQTPQEQQQLKLKFERDHYVLDQINQLPPSERTAAYQLKDKLAKLRGNVGVQEQIREALKTCQKTIDTTLKLQRNPEFYELSPEERQEYITYLKDDLEKEQKHLDSSIEFGLQEIRDLQKLDRIQALPEQSLPYLPLPAYLTTMMARQQQQQPPTSSSSTTTTTNLPRTTFDPRDIAPQCNPIALDYQRCIRRVGFRYDDVLQAPECRGLAGELYRCQESLGIDVMHPENNRGESHGDGAYSTVESIAKSLTSWLWGEAEQHVTTQTNNNTVPQTPQQPLPTQLHSIQTTNAAHRQQMAYGMGHLYDNMMDLAEQQAVQRGMGHLVQNSAQHRNDVKYNIYQHSTTGVPLIHAHDDNNNNNQQQQQQQSTALTRGPAVVYNDDSHLYPNNALNNSRRYTGFYGSGEDGRPSTQNWQSSAAWGSEEFYKFTFNDQETAQNVHNDFRNLELYGVEERNRQLMNNNSRTRSPDNAAKMRNWGHYYPDKVMPTSTEMLTYSEEIVHEQPQRIIDQKRKEELTKRL